MEQLDQTVRENLGQVTLVDGRPQMGEGFQFYENGVYTLVYSQDKTLLAGQVPVAFTAAEPFHNGLTRLVDTDTGQYYVLDFWVPAGWEEGLWVRGLLEVPAGAQSMPALLWVAAVSLPLFLLLAAVGGYWIARRAFRPLEHITATADAISQASDLSARVAVPSRRQRVQPAGCHLQPDVCPAGAVLRGRDQFTADASHELRTPVSVIKSACEYGETYGETLEEQPGDPGHDPPASGQDVPAHRPAPPDHPPGPGDGTGSAGTGGSGPPWPGRCVPRAPGPRIA